MDNEIKKEEKPTMIKINRVYVLLILLFLLPACVKSVERDSRSMATKLSSELAESWYTSIDQNISIGDSIIDVASVFNFEWDQLIVPKAYTNLELLKKKYSGINSQMEKVKYDDARSLLMFSKKSKVISYIYLSNTRSNFSSSLKDEISVFQRENSVFKIDILIINSKDTLVKLIPQ